MNRSGIVVFWGGYGRAVLCVDRVSKAPQQGVQRRQIRRDNNSRQSAIAVSRAIAGKWLCHADGHVSAWDVSKIFSFPRRQLRTLAKADIEGRPASGLRAVNLRAPRSPIGVDRVGDDGAAAAVEANAVLGSGGVDHVAFSDGLAEVVVETELGDRASDRCRDLRRCCRVADARGGEERLVLGEVFGVRRLLCGPRGD